MDVFYEESAIDQKSAQGQKKYKIIGIFASIAILFGFLFLLWGILSIPLNPMTEEAYSAQLTFCVILLLQAFVFIAIWFFLTKWKGRFNVSYDYSFISGDLRISRVVNNRTHRKIAEISYEDIIQIGDVDNTSYSRLKNDPNTKLVVCTPNATPDEGKFFMYVLASHNGKKLFILECRETLLMNILKFARRGVLESDYVSQDKKE